MKKISMSNSARNPENRRREVLHSDVAMKRIVPEDKAASVEESAAAAAALTDDDMLELFLYGKLRIARIGRAADDRDHLALLGEALNRTLEGRRVWNKKHAFVQHLKNTMQSISGHWAEKFVSELQGRAKIRTDIDSRTDLIDTAPGAEDCDPFEDEDDRIAAVMKFFEGDAEASVIVGAWQDGLKGPEIKKILGFDEKAYRTKVRWIQRQLIAAGYRRPTATQKGPRP